MSMLCCVRHVTEFEIVGRHDRGYDYCLQMKFGARQCFYTCPVILFTGGDMQTPLDTDPIDVDPPDAEPPWMQPPSQDTWDTTG